MIPTPRRPRCSDGDVDLGIVWSGEAAILYKQNKKFQYVLPEEGAHQFIDSLAIPKGAPNKENAEKFINYILRPEVSVLISKEFPYTNPNAEAVKLLKPEQRDNPASYPPGDPKLETFKDIGKAAAMIDKLITDLKGKAEVRVAKARPNHDASPCRCSDDQGLQRRPGCSAGY